MWLTHGWPVKAAYGFVTLTFAATVALVHPKPEVQTQTVIEPGRVIILPSPPPRVVYRRVRVRVPVIVSIPGPLRTIIETETIAMPGPTVTVLGPVRTVTVIRRVPIPPPTRPPPAPPVRRRRGRGHHPVLVGSMFRSTGRSIVLEHGNQTEPVRHRHRSRSPRSGSAPLRHRQ